LVRMDARNFCVGEKKVSRNLDLLFFQQTRADYKRNYRVLAIILELAYGKRHWRKGLPKLPPILKERPINLYDKVVLPVAKLAADVFLQVTLGDLVMAGNDCRTVFNAVPEPIPPI